MFYEVYVFAKRGALPRAKKIVQGPHLYLAGIVSYIVSERISTKDLSISLSPFLEAILTYNIVIVGFTITCIAFSISIPNQSFMKFISDNRGEKFSPYQDLLFIYGWTSFIHWLCFIMIIFLFFLFDIFGKSYVSESYDFFIFFIFGLFQIYGIFQFGVSIVTVFQISDLYAKYLSSKYSDPDDYS